MNLPIPSIGNPLFIRYLQRIALSSSLIQELVLVSLSSVYQIELGTKIYA